MRSFFCYLIDKSTKYKYVGHDKLLLLNYLNIQKLWTQPFLF